MKPNTGYVCVESKPPLRGLATNFPSNKIPSEFSPNLLNCVIRDGQVFRRAGGNQLGQQLVGVVLDMANFGPLGEAQPLVVLTSKRQYAYDESTDKFVDLTPNQTAYAIIAIGTAGSYFEIAGDHVAEFTVLQDIPVVGGVNEGVYAIGTISLVGGNTRLGTVPPSPTQTIAGNIVVADELTTGPTDFINSVAITDLNSHRFLMTNGKDSPLVWDGDLGNEFEEWAPNYTNFVTCKTFEVFSEHLFLGWVITSVGEPLGLAWSAAGDFDEFETGDSGFQLMYQLGTGIRALKVLGDRIAIYSNDTIMTGVFVGLPAVFIFEVVIPNGIRLVGPKAIASINVGHVFLSEENIYLFDGTRGLRVLGDSIYTDYKQFKDFANLQRTTLLNDFAKRTIYFAVPFQGSRTTVYTARYDVFNLADIVWAKEEYEDNVRSWGYHINVTEILTWEDAPWETNNTPWRDEIGIWSEESEQIGFPIRVYGTPEGRVVIVTEGIASDRGEDVVQFYETKDFEVPELEGSPIGGLGTGESLLGRWTEIEFEAAGIGFTVMYSVDRGRVYNLFQEVELQETFVTYRIPIDHVGRTLRVRFQSFQDGWSLRTVRAWVRPGGPQ